MTPCLTPGLLIETPFSGQWRNLGLATVGTSIYAVGGWDGDQEAFMDSVVSYQFIYQLFLPISNQAGDDSMTSMKIGNHEFNWGQRTYVMGIINVTPDSFSGDGLLGQEQWVARAVAQAEMFAEAGADILDVGGESTRPGATVVDTEDEINRVLPVIEAHGTPGSDSCLH
jgi:hypothetical protein